MDSRSIFDLTLPEQELAEWASSDKLIAALALRETFRVGFTPPTFSAALSRHRKAVRVRLLNRIRMSEALRMRKALRVEARVPVARRPVRARPHGRRERRSVRRARARSPGRPGDDDPEPLAPAASRLRPPAGVLR